MTVYTSVSFTIPEMVSNPELKNTKLTHGINCECFPKHSAMLRCEFTLRFTPKKLPSSLAVVQNQSHNEQRVLKHIREIQLKAKKKLEKGTCQLFSLIGLRE